MKTQFLRKTLNALKKNAPSILMGVGVVGTVTGTVLACKSTLSLPPVLEEHNSKVEELHDDAENMDEKDVRKETFKIYMGTTVKVVKLFGPAALIFGGSIGCLLGSHKMMKNRLVNVSSLAGSLASGFASYRKNVVDRYGDIVDKELLYGIKEVKPKKGEVVDPDAPKKFVATSDDPKKLLERSIYARFFDETCPDFSKIPSENLAFLRAKQNQFNDLLRSHEGNWICLNEVYTELGLPKTYEGQFVGWRYSTLNPTGDNFISFNIYDINSPAGRAFVNGYESVILLDFNVDGDIRPYM